MSAKFLHTFADENPELQRQIGCMTGIFQMFDRQHLIAGRRLGGQNHRRITSGHNLLTSSNNGGEHNPCPPQILLEKNFSKSSNENGVSMESTRSSFSSSSCSSFSSLDCNKSTQQETPLMDYPERSVKNLPKLKNYDSDATTAQATFRTDPANSSHRPSLDFRDVIKDSIYKDNYALSVKTSVKEELKNRALKHKDSPRPMTEASDRLKTTTDLNESLQDLRKFEEASWHLTERNESRRKSYEAKDSPFVSVSGDAPRFSYDGQDFGPFLYSRDGGKLSSKLKELPRLSLDSREGSLRGSGFDSRTHSIPEDLERSRSTRRAPIAEDNRQAPESYKRPPSVVAKLMGLEAMPTPNQERTYENTSTLSKKNGTGLTTRTSIITYESKEDKLLNPPKSFRNGQVTPVKSFDPLLKSQSHSRLSIEPAPWGQREKIRVPQKMAFKYKDAHAKQQPESVYNEIEKRLKDLEFQQSNKDLRALKQILYAMHAKGLLETKRVENQLSDASVYATRSAHSLKPAEFRSTRGFLSERAQSKGSNTVRGYESPIVIMKPANSINRLGTSASIIPLDHLTDPQRTSNPPVDKRNASTHARINKDQSPKVSSREPNSRPPLATEKKVRKEDNGHQKTRSRIPDSSENYSGISTKTSNSLSPRLLQQKRLEVEKKCRVPVPSLESNKPPRPSANRHSSETVSTRTRLRRKPAQSQQRDDQLSDASSGTASLSHQDDEPSGSGSCIGLSKVDIEVSSVDQSEVLNGHGIAADNASSTVSSEELNTDKLNEEISAIELPAIVHEQTSPNSVLVASLYENNLPAGKEDLKSYTNDESCNAPDCCSPTEEPETPTPEFSSRINQKKLANIENLVQKLRELSSSVDETAETDHIASLCETQNPDHRYVSEILLASGLLMKDFTSGPLSLMQTQLHPSGYLINPDLFFVLEQTKSSWFAKPEAIHESIQRPKSDPGKLQRKLVFNLVNDLLLQKLENCTSSPYPSLAKYTRFPSGQQLLKELCCDIEKIKTESLAGSKHRDDDNLMSGEDMLNQYGKWNNFNTELPAVVLEIERSIFKELIDEVVNVEPGLSPQVKAPRRPRNLFAK